MPAVRPLTEQDVAEGQRIGFRPRLNVVTVHRPNAPCYSRPGVFALDDWR
ncbi:MAG TPA: hypothetical protein VFA03_13640 [Acetobacteraceae bacterium]|nr:hypothetical protein [Acetobacteraceae bacterium]